MKVSGKFDVTLDPLDSYTKGEDGVNLRRMSIDKRFFMATLKPPVKVKY
jgi:hypothetical protein